jgi:hypothetical protein
MSKRVSVLAVLALMLTELAGCADLAVQPCERSPYESIGPCSVGKHKDS